MGFRALTSQVLRLSREIGLDGIVGLVKRDPEDVVDLFSSSKSESASLRGSSARALASVRNLQSRPFQHTEENEAHNEEKDWRAERMCGAAS